MINFHLMFYNFCYQNAIHSNFKQCHVLEGKPDGKRPLGRPRRREEDNIKIELRGVGLGGDGSG
jgi:hypothetical protein